MYLHVAQGTFDSLKKMKIEKLPLAELKRRMEALDRTIPVGLFYIAFSSVYKFHQCMDQSYDQMLAHCGQNFVCATKLSGVWIHLLVWCVSGILSRGVILLVA
jgi:hypothetical protein